MPVNDKLQKSPTKSGLDWNTIQNIWDLTKFKITQQNKNNEGQDHQAGKLHSLASKSTLHFLIAILSALSPLLIRNTTLPRSRSTSLVNSLEVLLQETQVCYSRPFPCFVKWTSHSMHCEQKNPVPVAAQLLTEDEVLRCQHRSCHQPS